MKTMKTTKSGYLTVGAAMMSNRDERSRSPRVIRCCNLRRRGGRLEYVGLPREVEVRPDEVDEGGRLVDVLTHHRLGRIGVFECVGGDRIGVARLDLTEPTMHVLGRVSGDVTQALMLREDRISVLTANGVSEITIDGDDFGWIDAAVEYPQMKFEIRDESKISVAIAGSRLTGTYTADSDSLTPTDSSAFHGGMIGAIEHAVSDAASRGRLAQGVLVRYKLIDHGGRVVYCSSPQLIAPSTGLNFGLETWARVADDFKSYCDRTLEAMTFRVALKAPSKIATDWSRLVGSAEVEMSLPLHPVTASGGGSVRLQRRSDGTLIASGSLGGSAAAQGEATSRSRAIVNSALSAGEATFKRVAVIRNPLDQEGAEWIVGQRIEALEGFATQVELLRRSVAATTSVDNLSCWMRSPHRFTAATAVKIDGRTLWGDVTVMCSKAPSVGTLAIDTTAGAWQGWVMVELADREHRLVSLSEGADGVPVTLAPMLYYPSPRAVSMSVMVRSGGVVRFRRFKLTPTADGSGAVYTDEDCGRIDLPIVDEPWVEPQPSGGVLHFPHAIALTDNGGVGVPDRVIEDGASGRIVAMVEGDRRSSSWEGARRRVYLFTTDSIRLLSVADDGSLLRQHPVSQRGVMSRRSVTSTGCSEAQIVAVAGGDLVALRRGSACELISGVGDASVAWDCVDRELWLVSDREGYPRVIPECGPEHYQFVSLACGRVFTTSKGLIAEDDERRLLDIARGRDNAPGQVAWEVEMHNRWWPSRRVAEANVDLLGCRYLPQIKVLAGMTQVGSVDMPLTVTPKMPGRLRVATLQLRGEARVESWIRSMMCAPRPWAWICIEGEADGSVTLGGCRLVFEF